MLAASSFQCDLIFISWKPGCRVQAGAECLFILQHWILFESSRRPAQSDSNNAKYFSFHDNFILCAYKNIWMSSPGQQQHSWRLNGVARAVICWAGNGCVIVILLCMKLSAFSKKNGCNSTSCQTFQPTQTWLESSNCAAGVGEGENINIWCKIEISEVCMKWRISISIGQKINKYSAKY